MPRVYVRRFDYDEARRRFAAGETLTALAREYGVHPNPVRTAVDDEFRARLARASAAWVRGGVCPVCGAQTTRHRLGGDARCVDCSARAAAKVRDGSAYCPTCDTWKSLDDFSPSATRGVRGVHSECRACDTARRRANRAANRGRERARDREYKRSRKAAA